MKNFSFKRVKLFKRKSSSLRRGGQHRYLMEFLYKSPLELVRTVGFTLTVNYRTNIQYDKVIPKVPRLNVVLTVMVLVSYPSRIKDFYSDP